MLSKNLFLADTGTFCYKQEQLVLTFISQKKHKRFTKYFRNVIVKVNT